MNVLIVNAYPEDKSFGGKLRDDIHGTIAAAGHSVTRSDLYAMKFTAVDYPDDFASRLDPNYFSLEAEQRHAYNTGTLPLDVKAEQEKIKQADAVLFLCPVYWASAPAILKGWFERVFTPEFSYGQKQKFANAPLKGKKALFVTSSGGLMGANDKQQAQTVAAGYFDPLCRSPLRYCGFDVLQTRAIIAPQALPEAEKQAISTTTASRILRDIQKSVVTPSPKTGVLIHLNGRPGVGKKTIAQAYADAYGAILVDNHTLLNPGLAVSGRDSAGYYRVAKSVRSAVYAEIEEGLRQGKHYILTNALTNEVPLHREVMDEITQLAHRAEAVLCAQTLFCDHDVNLKRVQSAGRAEQNKLTDPIKLADMFNKFTMILDDTHDFMNVTSASPQKAAKNIHASVQDMLAGRSAPQATKAQNAQNPQVRETSKPRKPK